MGDSSAEPPAMTPCGVDYQPASLDIWDRKYRLKRSDGTPVDSDIDATFQRVARALAELEEGAEKQEKWYREFLWALRNGAIPAGRIIANAGAGDLKLATSTINCTVSGTIHDSMDSILTRLHEAGLTLKAGCGIGYEFSTLRPKGAYVSGPGSHTSGPLSFMDIYDRMCRTISSAGGRRGAQMATFDIGHPDVTDFIRAKREPGRLRQFNLSLLITEDFMQAVEADAEWPLAFPISEHELEHGGLDLDDPEQVLWRHWPVTEGYRVNDRGEVACRIYRKLPARRLWELIMRSTYDFAEPGFILIDRVNELNNNWWCEEIRATNPCVTADTRLHTADGLVTIGELYARGERLQVTVDRRTLEEGTAGCTSRPATAPFMTAREADVYRVTTEDGYEIRATSWHQFYTDRGKLPLREIRVGDSLLVQSGKGQFGARGSRDLGVLLGLLTGDGHFTNRGKGQQAAVINLWGADRVLAPMVAAIINSMIAGTARSSRCYRVSPVAVETRNHCFIRSVLLARLLREQGIEAESKLRVPEIIWQGNEECVTGYLQALFQADGTVNVSPKSQSCSIRLSSSHQPLLQEVQLLLSNYGIFCRIRKRREAGERLLPDGKGGRCLYSCKADWELIIDGRSRERFMEEIGFLLDYKNERYRKWVEGRALLKSERFMTRIRAITHAGREPVFDITQKDHNSVIFNGLVTGQCGEQPLPPYGSCLLGSINLTRFVREPFTERCAFDWDAFRRVVAIFTRMLDNVVEINGLPLEQQRREILEKRRHGMGFLGLGSALAMLRIRYGDAESIEFTGRVARELALAGWEQALELAREKGPAPVLSRSYEVTEEMLRLRPEMAADGIRVGDEVPGRVLHARYSRYMQRIAGVRPELVEELAETGARFTHHSSIAPTGTISLSLANNASNGIEPSFAHHYVRNIIVEGKKTKEPVDVWSCELLAYRALIDPGASPEAGLPEWFITSDQVTPEQHVEIQAAAQKWVDSSISKTINVPTDLPFEAFHDIYRYAYRKGLKGCTTFRFNPEAFQGVLVREEDLENTLYRFELEDGRVIEVKGNEEIEYDGEVHTAANLFDALKEGYYGKL